MDPFYHWLVLTSLLWMWSWLWLKWDTDWLRYDKESIMIVILISYCWRMTGLLWYLYISHKQLYTFLTINWYFSLRTEGLNFVKAWTRIPWGTDHFPILILPLNCSKVIWNDGFFGFSIFSMNCAQYCRLKSHTPTHDEE